MRYYDHTQTPPAPIRLPDTRAGTNIPAHCPPARLAALGIHPDGGRDPVPPGMRATGWERVVRDGLSVVVPTGLEAIPEPAGPPEAVLQAAMALQLAVAQIADLWGVTLDVTSGYAETYRAIFGPDSPIPPVERASAWALLDTSYRNLEYHVSRWQTGASAWDLLPQIAAALQPGDTAQTPSTEG